MKSIRGRFRAKRRPDLLSFISLLSPLPFCIAGNYESDRFSSSIVTSHHDNDLSLSGSRRRPQHHHHGNDHNANRYDLRIQRSFIDRDPIYFEDGESILFSDDDDYMMDQIDPYSSQTNQWRSPLESLAPLPSLSLPESGTAATITPALPITIHPGPRHSHEINIAKQQQQLQNNPPPMKLKTRSTGTTITALVAQNSTVLILAADTRATDGTTVADKRCEKLHALARNVWCAGAGTSADVDALVRRVKFAFWKRGALTKEGCGGGVGNMDSVSNNSQNNSGMMMMMDATIAKEDREVPSASMPAILHYIRTRLQKTGGSLGANLLVGGYDVDSRRAYLAAVHPHGSMDVVTYAALGSGGLAATGVLESRYPVIGSGECSVEEGIRLAVDAVRAGVDNDLGSGSQVDVCVIRREGVLYRRAVVREEELEWIGEDGGEYLETPTMSMEEVAASGVNGFGNVPFAIQSKKLVSGGQLDAEQERRRWLAGVLGDE